MEEKEDDYRRQLDQRTGFAKLKDALNGPFRRWEALSILFVLHLIAFSFFRTVNEGNTHDFEITLVIFSTFVLLTLGIALWTKKWTWTTIAILAIFLADTGLYLYLTTSYPEGPDLSENTRSIFMRALRSMFTVGCLLMLGAMWHEWRNGYKPQSFDQEVSQDYMEQELDKERLDSV